MITNLIITFALCRLPLKMVSLLWFYRIKNTDDMETLLTEDLQKFKVWIHIRDYLNVLSKIDMALRPVIYATMSREFGQVFDRVINCTYCRQEEEVATVSRYHGDEIQEVLETPLQTTQPQEGTEEEPDDI